MIKFGKKYQDIIKIKANFIKDNNLFLSKQKAIAELYKKQPIRNRCKVCGNTLKGNFFYNHKIKYILCKRCTHVNGIYQDTKRFSNEIYLSENINYSKNYKSINVKNFIFRQKMIYDPKAEFLKKVLKNPKNIKVLDYGCGSGYFVSSLIDKGFKDTQGFEVSITQVDYGKKIFKKIKKNSNLIDHFKSGDAYKIISNTNANCLTLIGVLEHLVDVPSFLNTIKKNKNIKYIYLCVPMFSFSCVIENIFSQVYNRHLGGGHTHLFTEKSLKILMNKYDFKEKAAWWFGTDIPDLYRSFLTSIYQNNSKALESILKHVSVIIDDLQIALDKKKLSSQVHMVFQRK